jgi:predicted DCC family thiol-disulfide oxidoreductase YuxK
MQQIIRKKTLLYDGSCRTCRVMKDAADKTVSNYEFIDATSEEGRRLVQEKNLQIDSSAYVLDGERTLSKSDMALEFLHDVRMIGPALATLGKLIPVSTRDDIYEWLVRHRIK